MSQAIDDVIAERKRQIEVEGFTPARDDEYNNNELASAAACYAICNSECELFDLTFDGDMLWPWQMKWWKPTTYRQNLVKAAALLIAEIEQVDRMNKRLTDKEDRPLIVDVIIYAKGFISRTVEASCFGPYPKRGDGLVDMYFILPDYPENILKIDIVTRYGFDEVLRQELTIPSDSRIGDHVQFTLDAGIDVNGGI